MRDSTPWASDDPRLRGVPTDAVLAYIYGGADSDGWEECEMLIAADYPFLDVLWTLIIFFAWVIYIWIAITVLIDVFRRHDIGGWGKAAWAAFVIVLPFLGVLIYLIAQHEGMRERSMSQAEAQKAAFDQYVRETAGGSAAEIARAKELLDAGTITQEEFDAIKAKALS
jgi:Phospholipase_D-nuclease N-terminal/Short C-terminal domain